MTETKAAEVTTELPEQVKRCVECGTALELPGVQAEIQRLNGILMRVSVLLDERGAEVEAKDAEIARLTTERDDARREADRAQARASRIAELNPEGEMDDDDMQEALREIESLQVQNVQHENKIAALASRCEALTKLVREFSAHPEHDSGCSAQWGYPCKCGMEDLLAEAESLLSTASDEGKATSE